MPMGRMDCADLEAATEIFMTNNKITIVPKTKCYYLLWYLLSGNIDQKLMVEIPLDIVEKGKNFIIRRKYHVQDGKRSRDITTHYNALCGYLQFYERVAPTRRPQRPDQLHRKGDDELSGWDKED